MAWSDAARAAAAEMRRRKAAEHGLVKNARTGIPMRMPRAAMAAQMKKLRSDLRGGKLRLKKDLNFAKSQLSNYRLAAKNLRRGVVNTPAMRVMTSFK